jgi:hypothetical protein
MTDRQTQTLRNAYLQRAKVKVLMAAKPDNAIARFEAKHGPLH